MHEAKEQGPHTSHRPEAEGVQVPRGLGHASLGTPPAHEPVGVGREDVENPGAGKALGTGMQGLWVAAGRCCHPSALL